MTLGLRMAPPRPGRTRQASRMQGLAPAETPPDTLLSSGRRGTAGQQVYRQIRRDIIAGTFLPLHPLSESALAASFGVSRTPVREAFGKLEEDGLVAIRPQYGTFVAPIRIDRIAGDHFVREALECAAVQEAARRCTPADAADLRGRIELQRTLDSDKAFFDADDGLHQALMTIAGHQAAWHVVDSAKVNLDRVRHLSARGLFKRRQILAEHDRIVAAVTAQAPAEAATAMRQHLLGVFNSSEAMMKAHPEYFQPGAADLRPRRRPPAWRST